MRADANLEPDPGAVVEAVAFQGGACQVHHVQGEGVADVGEGGGNREAQRDDQGQLAGDGRLVFAGPIPEFDAQPAALAVVVTDVERGKAESGLPVLAARDLENQPQIEACSQPPLALLQFPEGRVVFQFQLRTGGEERGGVDLLVDPRAVDQLQGGAEGEMVAQPAEPGRKRHLVDERLDAQGGQPGLIDEHLQVAEAVEGEPPGPIVLDVHHDGSAQGKPEKQRRARLIGELAG